MVEIAPRTELEEWDSAVTLYNDDYEKLNEQIKDNTKLARRLLHQKKPSTEIADALLEISICLQRMVELNAEAGYNYRGTKNFYERALIAKKFEIMRNAGEKKVAANVAEGEAVLACQEEFFVFNTAERYMEATEKRYEATKELAASLRSKLEYGYKP